MLDEEMDHMDQMIREAANNHHPAYNDKAWEKMELQLDKHLPQKKDRRRLIFFLLFFLLVGGTGAFLLLNNRSGNDKNTTVEKNSSNKKEKDTSTADYTAQSSQSLKEEAQLIEKTNDNSQVLSPEVSDNSDDAEASTYRKNKPQNGNTNNDNSVVVTPANNNSKTVTNTRSASVTKPKPQKDDTKVNSAYADAPYNKNNDPKLSSKQITLSKLKPQKAGRKNNYTTADDLSKGNDHVAATRKQKIDNKFKTKTRITSPSASEDVQPDEILANKNKPVSGSEDSKLKVSVITPAATGDEIVATTSAPAEESKDKKLTEDEKKEDREAVKDSAKSVEDKKLVAITNNKPESPSDKKKKENKFSNNFGITFSVGPDVSFVKLNNTGKTTLTYGAGISYGFAKRFTARAGFYVSQKRYEALPDQYHTPGGNYPYLTDIDADCRIYEIPVSLSYSFGQRKKHNWFGSVGLSSFIMKKEDYVYNYKTPTGQTYNYYYSASNQNKHYFSVLNLSGGYQYHLNKWLSLQAEPYLQIPLGGVGMGKIKLNSAGVLFTVTVKPFAKKK